MQNIEPDQVQLEHNAQQEPAGHTQEPLQYAPVASSDHDRRFQKVRFALTRWRDGEQQRAPMFFGCVHFVTRGCKTLMWLHLLACHVWWPTFSDLVSPPMSNSKHPVRSVVLLQKVPPTTVAPTYKLTLPSEFVLTHMPDMMAGDFIMISADGTQSFTVSIVPRYAVDFSQYHAVMHIDLNTWSVPVFSVQAKQG